MTFFSRFFAASGITLLAAGSAIAAPAQLVLMIGGEAYDGAPAFSLSFGGTEIGTGQVTSAIDTAAVGRFTAATDRSQYVQSFVFDIPEAVFATDGELAVTFTNEAFGGEGSDRDRNLFLLAASINGRVVLGPDFSGDGRALLDTYMALENNDATVVAAAPAGGWPALGVATPVAAAPKIATRSPSIVLVKADSTKADVLPPSSAASDVIEVASIATDPVATGTCNRDELYNVVGFNENSNDLTPGLMQRLDEIIADIGQEKCAVRITGYSSTQGDYATNALFAIERAQNVLAYFRTNGLAFDDVSATGGGETEQFGDRPSVNRRVVIAVGP
ncbi:MAG: hypothetical protein JWR75_2137 [Devosia sp.]|nr:hypothetical protein [Devosia sp.]